MIVSAMVAIFTVGLGTRKEGEASAYSIFNGFNELPGAIQRGATRRPDAGSRRAGTVH